MRTKQKKPRIFVAVIAATFIAIIGGGTWNTLRPLPAIAVTQQSVTVQAEAANALVWPSIGGAAVEAQGITTTFTSGSQKALPTASIAKVITCLVVLQAKPLNAGELGPTITLTQADVDIYNSYIAKDGSVVRVAPGEQLTEYQALQALLLPSANNIADSLAIWAFGSLSAYHTAAAQYVQQLGLTNTTIGSDASGLAPDTTSTPSDLVRLGELALANSVIAQIVAQSTVTLPVEGTVHNVNQLVGSDGIIGIKTGNSDEVGGNMLFAATTTVTNGKKITIIGAIMGQNSLGAALKAVTPLLDSVKTNLYVVAPVHAGETIATYTSSWGQSAAATAKKGLSFVNWKGNPVKPQVKLQQTNLSYDQGAIMGTVSATSGTASATSDVVLSKTITQPSLWWRLTRH
ncbi:MAG TPA: serine hydrolase [Patescibacteria group bacterium]|nr:serine hydrolase [Patescibacteria group bacterium]